MSRRTKIVATIGPASDDPRVLADMLDAGMDVARIGLAHSGLDDALDRYRRVRAAGELAGRPLGILVDLPGPKVRCGSFVEGGIAVSAGDMVRLTPGSDASDGEVIHVSYDNLLTDLQVGDRVAFGDGIVRVEVADTDGDALRCRVTHGGRLQGRPGVHIPSDRLRISTPTPEDLTMLDAFVEAGVDMVAVSFVRSAHDVRRVGTEPYPRGPLVVAKVETRAAVDNLTGIIEASGAIMVARGDLGNECEIADLPHLQKEIIRQCIALGRPAITATQMLESMVHNAAPTRAEASDVYNAVGDGSSALMLSGETAIGRDPAGVVRTMHLIAEQADTRFDYTGWAHNLERLRDDVAVDGDAKITDVMTSATWRASTEMKCSAIICLSKTGFTIRSIARFRPEAPILGFSADPRTVRQLAMSWGTVPMLHEQRGSNQEMVEEAVTISRDRGLVRSGDVVMVLAGVDQRSKATDVLRMVRVP